MMWKLLCRLGVHNWKRSNGFGIDLPGTKQMLVLFDLDCRCCGKHKVGTMTL